jgi:hypothetical protein
MNDGRNNHLMTRRTLFGLFAGLLSRPAQAWDFGTVRSKFTAIIRKKRDGPIRSEWRSSEYMDFTILGMNVRGGADDFHIDFTLVHDRKIRCELTIEGSKSDAAQFALWLADEKAELDPKDLSFGSIKDENVQQAAVERTLGPGSYKLEVLWRGRRGTEIIGPQGNATLVVTIHNVGGG